MNSEFINGPIDGHTTWLYELLPNKNDAVILGALQNNLPEKPGYEPKEHVYLWCPSAMAWVYEGLYRRGVYSKKVVSRMDMRIRGKCDDVPGGFVEPTT